MGQNYVALIRLEAANVAAGTLLGLNLFSTVCYHRSKPENLPRRAEDEGMYYRNTEVS